MKFLFQSSALLLFFILFSTCKPEKTDSPEHHTPPDTTKKYVLLISMDGFRWDYTGKANTPNFDKIAQKGVRAEAMQASFPTKTFPNHYTLATGLYPDHHGIILNRFYAPELGKSYSISNSASIQDGDFYGGEPIWCTAEKQGMKTATYFWVGSEAKIGGIRPTYWKKYDHYFPFSQRIDTVMYWFSLPEKQRPHLVLLYFHQPDSDGHSYGPDSPQIISSIETMDGYLGEIMEKAARLPIANILNIIVLSDHGMANISDDRKIILSDYLDVNDVERIEGGNPNYCIQAKPGKIEKIYNDLKNIEHLNVWKKGEVPGRFHFGENARTLDLFVTAENTWSVYFDEKSTEKSMKGTHGYDNEEMDMHAIFYAYGPAFKEAYVAPTFTNVDIYPLLAEILGLEPAPTDGKLNEVKAMLKGYE